MKGLERIPTEGDLTHASERLQYFASEVELVELTLFAQWSRFDARLAEIWVSFIAKYWSTLNPVALNSLARNAPWPEAIALLIDLSRVLVSERDLSLFLDWRRCAQNQIKPGANGALFFIGTRKFAGSLMRKDAELSAKTYLRWGYLGHERLTNKASGSRKTAFGKKQRLAALDGLLATRDRVDVGTYIQSLGGEIHPRLAQLDLSQDPRLCALGNTRGRVYVLRSRRRAILKK